MRYTIEEIARLSLHGQPVELQYCPLDDWLIIFLAGQNVTELAHFSTDKVDMLRQGYPLIYHTLGEFLRQVGQSEQNQAAAATSEQRSHMKVGLLFIVTIPRDHYLELTRDDSDEVDPWGVFPEDT
jgi:hypothetical protein